ncbi:MAG: DHH family phosphoesterase [Sulfolobales archaeon]
MGPLYDINISEFLDILTPRSYCLITHRNADLDALASALVLREIIVRITSRNEVYVIVPDGLDSLSRYFLNNLNISSDYVYEDKVFDKSCDCWIVVDAASEEQLGRFNMLDEYLLVDHHEINMLADKAKVKLYDPRRKSTSELVALLALRFGVELRNEFLTLLIGGILYDSRFLYLADEFTFNILSELIKAGGDYVKARNLLTRRNLMDYSERIARLKAMSRLGIYRAGKYLVVITCIGAYEGNVLKILLDNGADIAIALARRDNGLRITIRVSEEVVNELGRPVAGLLASYLGDKLGGSGGGHSLASGSYIKCRDFAELLKVLESFFRSMTGNFKVLEKGRWLEECL